MLDPGPAPVRDARGADLLVLALDPVEHDVLPAGRQDLACSLDDVDDVRAELPQLLPQALPLVLGAAQQPRGHARGRHDERQHHDREDRLDDPQADLGEHGDHERHDERRGQVRREQLEQLDVGHRGPRHVARATR